MPPRGLPFFGNDFKYCWRRQDREWIGGCLGEFAKDRVTMILAHLSQFDQARNIVYDKRLGPFPNVIVWEGRENEWFQIDKLHPSTAEHVRQAQCDIWLTPSVAPAVDDFMDKLLDHRPPRSKPPRAIIAVLVKDRAAAIS